MGKIPIPSRRKSKEVLPTMIEAMKDTDKDVCCSATYALARIAMRAKETVPALIEALRDKDASVRSEAAKSQGWVSLSPVAKDAVPALIGAKRDKDEAVRQSATEALKEIQDE